MPTTYVLGAVPFGVTPGECAWCARWFGEEQAVLPAFCCDGCEEDYNLWLESTRKETEDNSPCLLPKS